MQMMCVDISNYVAVLHSHIAISKGNHDDCSWYAYKNKLGLDSVISPEMWYSYVVNPIRVRYPISIDENNKAGGYYYIDYPLHKIRVSLAIIT